MTPNRSKTILATDYTEIHGWKIRIDGSGDDKAKGNPVIAGVSRNPASSTIYSSYDRP